MWPAQHWAQPLLSLALRFLRKRRLHQRHSPPTEIDVPKKGLQNNERFWRRFDSKTGALPSCPKTSACCGPRASKSTARNTSNSIFQFTQQELDNISALKAQSESLGWYDAAYRRIRDIVAPRGGLPFNEPVDVSQSRRWFAGADQANAVGLKM